MVHHHVLEWHYHSSAIMPEMPLFLSYFSAQTRLPAGSCTGPVHFYHNHGALCSLLAQTGLCEMSSLGGKSEHTHFVLSFQPRLQPVALKSRAKCLDGLR